MEPGTRRISRKCSRSSLETDQMVSPMDSRDNSRKILLSYTQTIKLCRLDVYVYQFQMYECISFKFSPYKLLSFRNELHLRFIHLIISVAADNAANKSKVTTPIACVSVIMPNSLSTFKHH